MHSKVRGPAAALVNCPLHPRESFLFVAKRDVRDCQFNRRHVLGLDFLFELRSYLLGVGRIASSGERVAERDLRVGAVGWCECQCLTNYPFCGGELLLECQNQSLNAVALFSRRIHCNRAIEMVMRLIEFACVQIAITKAASH